MTKMRKQHVFVFGSNEAGIHGGGAAKFAYRQLDAQLGKGLGFGPLKTTYAIPTKDSRLLSLTIGKIKECVDKFIQEAKAHPHLSFKVTAIGCGLAGFKHSDIAPLFEEAPENCFFDTLWKEYLGESKNYWGSF